MSAESLHDPGIATFISEARELLAEMETALLACEAGPVDQDAINAIFRAAHTIKGSAGLFGLEEIVAFTHVVEGALDRVRAGSVPLTPALTAALIDCKDHMELLLRGVESGAHSDATLQAAGSALHRNLQQAMGTTDSATATVVPAPIDAAPAKLEACWHISVRFGREVLRNGMDPLSFIRYLATFGELQTVQITDDLPLPEELDPEACYVGFEIRFKTDAGQQRIEDAFEFVRDDCTLSVTPIPDSPLDEVAQIEEAPRPPSMLGEILVQSGSLSEDELQRALQQQKALRNEGVTPAPKLGEVLVEEGAVAPAVIEAAVQKQQEWREPKTSSDGQFIRVEAEKLENLINLVGELIIAGASTNLIARRAGLSELSESTSRLSRLVEEIRDSALQLRMVQIGSTFARFQRVVRDVSRQTGKDIRLVVSGGETELDKTLVELINDPLTHLVRNAIDHGIESSQVRLERGKPAQGTVRLDAYHDSGSVVIEVTDDGCGLDRERILAKARERGLVAPDAELSEREVFALVFEPGFSTAERVTNLSGRGVGMDVVKRNVHAIRGEVEIDSVPGNGTTVRIRLPLTLAIIDGFLVRAGRSSFVLPLDMVEECIEAEPANADDDHRHHFVNLRGRALPFARMRDVFGITGSAARRESIVVVRVGDQRAGFLVDELLGEHQTVIRPLPRIANQVPGLSGSTILADGSIALIVDAPVLVQKCIERSRQAA
jgi:two-component system chemotaxis sensor kinase CheA